MNPYTNPSLMFYVIKVTVYNNSSNSLEYYYFKENREFKTKGGETQIFMHPLSEPFDKSSISIDRSIPFFDEGRGSDSLGTIIITNKNSNFNFFLNCYVNKLPIDIYLGQLDWNFEDFNFLTSAYIANLIRNEQTIEFTMESATSLLNKPIIDTTLSTGDTKPIAFGHVQNCPGVLVSSNVDFQYNTIQLTQLVYVMDRGVNTVAYTDISSGDDKKVHLNNSNIGTVTFEFNSGQRGGTYLQYPGEISAYLAERAGLTVIEQTIDDLDTTKPFLMGIFCKEKTNYLDALDEVLGSIGGYYFLDFENKFNVGLIDDPNNLTPVLHIYDRAITGEVSIKQYSKPCYKLTLQYDKNYNVFTQTDLAGRITGSAMQWFIKEFRQVEYIDETIVPSISGVKQYHFFDTRTFNPTLIVNTANANTEVQSRWQIFSKGVYFLTLKVIVEPFTLLPGMGITISYSLNKLLENTPCQILEVKYLSHSVCELKCFFLL